MHQFEKDFDNNRYTGKLELPDGKFRGKPILNFLNEGKEVAILTEGILEDYKNITTPCKLHFHDLATTKKTSELTFDEYFLAIYGVLKLLCSEKKHNSYIMTNIRHKK